MARWKNTENSVQYGLECHFGLLHMSAWNPRWLPLGLNRSLALWPSRLTLDGLLCHENICAPYRMSKLVERIKSL